MLSTYLFSFKCRSMALCMIFKGFQLVIIPFSFRDLGVERAQYLVNFLRRHLFRAIFKMVGPAPALEDARSFTVLWSGRNLTMFIHSDRFELLSCFV